MITLITGFIKLMRDITIFIFKIIFCIIMAPIWFIIGFFKEE